MATIWYCGDSKLLSNEFLESVHFTSSSVDLWTKGYVTGTHTVLTIITTIVSVVLRFIFAPTLLWLTNKWIGTKFSCVTKSETSIWLRDSLEVSELLPSGDRMTIIRSVQSTEI
jgi:hypothetical protein